MARATQFLARLENHGVRFLVLEKGFTYTSNDPLEAEEIELLKTYQDEIRLILFAREAARFSPAATKAESLLPSQTQVEWWNWRHTSPKQLCDEKLSLVKHVRNFEPNQIQAALRRLVEEHSALRSSLHKGPSGPALTLNLSEDFPIEVGNLEIQDQAQVEKEIKRQIAEFTETHIRVDDRWMMRAKLFVLSESETYVALLLHHAIVDGPSIALIQADLDKLLAVDHRTEEVSTENSLQLVDYAEAEKTWFEGEAGSRLICYWKPWLDRQGKLYSPSGLLLEWKLGFNISRSFAFPTKIMDRIQTLSLKLKTIPFLFYLTVYAMSLSKWSGRNSFAVRCIASLRGTHARASIVGNLVTADPVEIFVPPDGNFLSVLQFVTAEYIGSTQMRIPSLLHFPAHPEYPGIEDTWLTGSIAATMNFLSSGYRRPQKGAAERDGFDNLVWPPAITTGALEEWSVPLWPMILRLYDLGTEAKGMFQFNEALITRGEQDELISIFFDTLKSCVTDLDAPKN